MGIARRVCFMRDNILKTKVLAIGIFLILSCSITLPICDDINDQQMLLPKYCTIAGNFTAPQLLSPTNGTLVQGPLVVFVWQEIDSEAMYLIQIDTNPLFASTNLVEFETENVSISLPLSENSWYWRVCVKNSTFQGEFSDEWFIVVLPPRELPRIQWIDVFVYVASGLVVLGLIIMLLRKIK